MKNKFIKAFYVLGLTMLSVVFIASTIKTEAHEVLEGAKVTNVISDSASENWIEPNLNQGTWTKSTSQVELDSFKGAYAMDGAVLLTNAANPLGAYEFSTEIHISDVKDDITANPMVGIIPWYIDEDNYLFVQLKYTTEAKYLLSQEEKAEGYGLQEIIFSGRYDGESKYYTGTSQQENTVFDALTVQALKDAKRAPKDDLGHKLGIRLENNSATATSYKATILYNDVEIGSSYAYYYNAIAKNLNVGFMGMNVKATFTNANVTDFYATNNTAALARDWKEANGYTYRVLNGVDSWAFDEAGNVTVEANEIKAGNKVKSNYKISGTNIAGYDTNRGFTVNPYATNAEGLPQNYEVKSTFKLNELATKKGSQGYGLLAWYKDDQNFVDVTFKRTVKALGTENEIVLFGWIDCSSSNIGHNSYKLPKSFDFKAEHTLRVQKKSTGFYVFLDDIQEPIISKSIKGTEQNYYYGYEGYGSVFSATKLEAKPIYQAYDEIAVLDDTNTMWRVSGKANDSWSFSNGSMAINAKEASDKLTARSYIIGASDISDVNMTVAITARVTLGANGYSELMLAPYLNDDNNFARIGLAWHDGKTFARVYAKTFTEDDIDAGKEEATYTLVETEIKSIDLSKEITIKAEKIKNTLSLYVNGAIIYGKRVNDIAIKSESFGLYLYDADLEISKLETIGYKKYTKHQVGDWTTSGMKQNEWTIDNDGNLAGDATYTKDMTHDELDGDSNYAIKKNEIGTSSSDYELTVRIKATAQSEAEDRVGVMMWYLDDDNFMNFFIDRWRADSTVPRTTIYGKLNGETLPVTYNHGGWLAEGDNKLENGMTQTEASQVTNWHTIKVLKQGNTFTCYIDEDTNGYISYVVEAGLPEANGRDVYSGIYALNDAVLVSGYDVTTIGGFKSHTLPCEAGKPFNDIINEPTLGSYTEAGYTDEFDKVSGNNGEVEPEKPDPEKPTPTPTPTPEPTEKPTEKPEEKPAKKGCGGSIAASSIAMVVLAGAVVALRKKKEN